MSKVGFDSGGEELLGFYPRNIQLDQVLSSG